MPACPTQTQHQPALGGASLRQALTLALALSACESLWAAAGPSSQQEAEAWLEQVLGVVETAAGLKYEPGQGRRPVRIRLAETAEAGRILGQEFATFLPPELRQAIPEPEVLGRQYLARYAFQTRVVLLLPQNLERVSASAGLTALEGMQLLKLVLAYACDLALLDSHHPLSERYYAPGNSDQALAQRAVWEGHARLAQEAVASTLGCTPGVKACAYLNTFSISPALDPKEEQHEQLVQMARITSMGRLAESGSRFIAALRTAQGPQGVLQALQRPPLRTAQILVPQDYLEGKGLRPTDQTLGEALARMVGEHFPPEQWENNSAPLGALSLRDIVPEAAWKGGSGPRKEFGASFDLDYIAGRSLVGSKRHEPSARAAALHVFRSAKAGERFIRWKEKLIKEDWERLKQERFAVRQQLVKGLEGFELPEETERALTAGLALSVHFVRQDGSEFIDSHYYLQLQDWLLELDLDVRVPPKLLDQTARKLIRSRQAEEAANRKDAPGSR